MVRVRPDRFDVDPDEPFERDRLDRQGRVEALCGLIERIESSAVIAVDGPFGSGKSVFVGMCAAHLRNRKVAVAEFNAWQQSHSRWPLIDLVSALGSDATLVERLVGIAVNLVWRTAKVGTRGLLDRDDFDKREDAARFDEWKQIEEKRAEFREALTEVAAGANGKLVVVIDELDRCLPRHALDLLDVVRHLFDVPGVVVVFGINQSELCQRIKSLFGPECDADVYLRRFVDLTVDLPDPVPEQLAGFLVETFGGAGLRDRLQLSNYSGQIIRLVAERSEMSLRDIEQMVYRLAQVLSVVAAPRQDDLVESWASEQAESHWVCWRLLSLEARMEPWQQNEEQVGRRRVGIPMRRRRRLCGWCGRCAPSWAPITARSGESRTSWVSASSRCASGSARPTSTTVMRRAPRRLTGGGSGSWSRRTASCAARTRS